MWNFGSNVQSSWYFGGKSGNNCLLNEHSLVKSEIFDFYLKNGFCKKLLLYEWTSEHTSHSAYGATSTELYGVKIDGFLHPNFM